MKVLQVEPLAFPEEKLLRWREGHYDILARLRASSFVKRILEEKLRKRRRPGRRFFGEAFVAAHLTHQEGYYGSFKWLTTWPARQSSGFAAEYRAALQKAFPSVSDLSSKAIVLCELLQGKKPVPPDLWLSVNGEHRFIEVKLPGDRIRSTQIAGLALIAMCLSSRDNLSVWVYNLYPEDGEPDPIPATVQIQFKEFCRICRQLNKRRPLP